MVRIKPTKLNVKTGGIKHEWIFPPGFTLVVDTREQNALFIKPPKGLLLTRNTLAAGDYSIKGFENQVAIERKNLEDFYGSIGNGRSRFKKELEKLRDYYWAALVIEGTEEQVLSGGYYSAMNPESIRGSIVSIEVRFRLGVYYAKDRRSAERWILDRLTKIYKLMRETK